jgi:7-keto-8-aminopelargonate synthetase-like enzyme
MLRTSVMATHTEEQIEEALRAFEVARSTSG